jgi:hypothetical protein
VDQSAHRIRGHEPEQPENDEDHRDGHQHDALLLRP